MMANKKSGSQTGKSRIKSTSTSAHPTGKSNEKKDADAVEESFGVHVINSQDVENHFGASGVKTGDGSVQPAANRRKAEVHLHLDERIWREAQAAARQAGLEMPEYVERALERFNSDSAK